MVGLHLDRDGLLLKVRGLNKFWALKDRLRIPFDCIREVEVNLDDAVAIMPGLRMPGTHIPGYYRAGTYFTKSGKHFYLRRKGNESIILFLTGHRFSRVVVDVDDPIDAVSQIITWMEERGFSLR